VHLGGRGKQGINHGKAAQGGKPSPTLCDAVIYWQDAFAEALDQFVEPSFEGSCLKRVSRPQLLNSLAYFADYQNAQEQFVISDPAIPKRDPMIASSAFANFGNYIGVNQVHRSRPFCPDRASA
jgi:hypothetical protein